MNQPLSILFEKYIVHEHTDCDESFESKRDMLESSDTESENFMHVAIPPINGTSSLFPTPPSQSDAELNNEHLTTEYMESILKDDTTYLTNLEKLIANDKSNDGILKILRQNLLNNLSKKQLVPLRKDVTKSKVLKPSGWKTRRQIRKPKGTRWKRNKKFNIATTFAKKQRTKKIPGRYELGM